MTRKRLSPAGLHWRELLAAGGRVYADLPMLDRLRIFQLGLVAAAVMVVVGSRDAVPEQQRASADSRSPRYVVVYLVSAADDSAAEVEEEAFPDRRHPTHSWHWRVFDPASGRDTLFMALQSFPTRVRWDPALRFVEYAVSNCIERGAWGVGARPVGQARLALDSGLCAFWSDR